MHGLKVFTRVDGDGVPKLVQAWCLNRERGTVGILLFDNTRLYRSLHEIGVAEEVTHSRLDSMIELHVSRNWASISKGRKPKETACTSM